MADNGVSPNNSFPSGLNSGDEPIKPYPFRHSIMSVRKRAVYVKQEGSLVAVIISTPGNPTPLQLKLFDLGGDEVVLVFCGLTPLSSFSVLFSHYNENLTASIYHSIPRQGHEKVVELWEREVAKVNELARKLCDDVSESAKRLQEEDVKRIMKKVCSSNRKYDAVPMLRRASVFMLALDNFHPSEHEMPKTEDRIRRNVECMMDLEIGNLKK